MIIRFSVLALLLHHAFTTQAQIDFQLEGIETQLDYHEDSDYLVVLVHGSGFQDMAGTTYFGENSECVYQEYGVVTFKIFDELTEGLYQDGFSVLRYEKLNRRGNDGPYHVTDFSQDLHRILQKIRNHEVLGKKKLLLFGWSEGVTVALHQLAYDTEIDGIITYGGVFMDPVTMKAESLAQVIQLCEGDERKAEGYRRQFIEQLNQTDDSTDANYVDEMILTANQYAEDGITVIAESSMIRRDFSKSYFRAFRRLTAFSNRAIVETSIPILLLFGETDLNVPIGNYHQVQQAMTAPKVTTQLLGDSDHYLRENFNHSINQEVFQHIRNWKKELN